MSGLLRGWPTLHGSTSLHLASSTAASSRWLSLSSPCHARRSSLPPGCRALRQKQRSEQPCYVLGIETSCDDTAAAVLDNTGQILSSVVSSQWDVHREFQGIVPHLAARSHEQNLPHVVSQALEEARQNPLHGTNGRPGADIPLAAIAVTVGPGLAPCLGTGMRFARQLGAQLNVPVLPVNHLEAHILVTQLSSPSLRFPFLTLLVSGGHTLLALAMQLGDYQVLGETMDDAVGEAYDKVARMLQLPSQRHAGKTLEEYASQGDPKVHTFTLPLLRHHGVDFSYSGLKTQVRRALEKKKTQEP
eukprot:g19791.t1